MGEKTAETPLLRTVRVTEKRNEEREFGYYGNFFARGGHADHAAHAPTAVGALERRSHDVL